MKKSKLFKVVLTTIIITTFFGCSRDEPFASNMGADQRFVVLSEGNFLKGNASAMAVMADSSVSADLFERANGKPMGDVAQTMTRIGDKYFITLSNSGKIEVVSATDFKSVATILYHFSPYHIAAIDSDRAVVSDAAAHKAWIINTKNYTVADSIDIGTPTQYVAVAAGKIFFACSVWDYERFASINSLKVADISNYKTLRTTSIAPMYGTKLSRDNQENLWILTADGVSCIDPRIESVVRTIESSTSGLSIGYDSKIDARDDNIYVNCRRGEEHGVYKLTTNDDNFPQTPLFIIPSNVNLYNMVATPDNSILLCDAVDYDQSGVVYEYSLTGEILGKFVVGVCPNFIYFIDK